MTSEEIERSLRPICTLCEGTGVGPSLSVHGAFCMSCAGSGLRTIQILIGSEWREFMSLAGIKYAKREMPPYGF